MEQFIGARIHEKRTKEREREGERKKNKSLGQISDSAVSISRKKHKETIQKKHLSCLSEMKTEKNGK